ncbi:uncharacterized protein MYCFIDRAFT_138667 [Pseudocercospora fijiensis CIRAD86]|uniref:Uncharacterized protein n=1 Tax=Pseudocercospora fijiensis (strain CIRAD86) TaxID=383855 RepID=M2YVR0_PSEFD|nr:uncharacterized protein MYCFIDRAFT_138667 [Pseudocercospora fijiensis CIRAD86]EME81770.1 hypothetical protein MYCFIDRAFT_138667 [Pseudocercospora fijiensis CIRAD86]
MHFTRCLSHIVTTLLYAIQISNACTICTNESPEPIMYSPAPWTLKGTIYSFFLLPGVGIPLFGDLPVKAFPPLERQYPEAMAGTYKGFLGMIQVIRYTESPVGPYDELLIVPGFFTYPGPDGSNITNVRVSRIYVSQKYTAWNGRENWNIPKHIARFDWTTDAGGGESVKIYPFDTSGDSSESGPSEKPFFQMSFSPLLHGIVQIPFSTHLYGLLGVNVTLVQPPVPQGQDVYGAMVGTQTAKSVVPGQSSDKTTAGTINLSQAGGDGEETGFNAVGDEYYPNFWPGLLSTNVGLRMEDATITFSEPVVWSV